jgi:hypothetical protein
VQSQPPLDGLNGLGRTKAILRLGAVQIIRDTLVCVWGGGANQCHKMTQGEGWPKISQKSVKYYLHGPLGPLKLYTNGL